MVITTVLSQVTPNSHSHVNLIYPIIFPAFNVDFRWMRSVQSKKDQMSWRLSAHRSSLRLSRDKATINHQPLFTNSIDSPPPRWGIPIHSQREARIIIGPWTKKWPAGNLNPFQGLTPQACARAEGVGGEGDIEPMYTWKRWGQRNPQVRYRKVNPTTSVHSIVRIGGSEGGGGSSWSNLRKSWHPSTPQLRL